MIFLFAERLAVQKMAHTNKKNLLSFKNLTGFLIYLDNHTL